MELTAVEAGWLGHNYFGVEHILLGLLSEEEGAAAHALTSLGVTLELARDRLVAIIPPVEEGEAPAAPSASSDPFTPRAKRVLELSLREALALGSNSIGTGHILLGIARENESVAARILLELGIDDNEIRTAVNGLLSERWEQTAPTGRRIVFGKVWIRIGPSADLLALLTAAAEHALDAGRAQIEIPDVLLSLARDETIAPLLAAAGVDESTIRARQDAGEPPSAPAGG